MPAVKTLHVACVNVLCWTVFTRWQCPTDWCLHPAALWRALTAGRQTWRGSWRPRHSGTTPPWATWWLRSTWRSTLTTPLWRLSGRRQMPTRTTRLWRTSSSCCSRPPCCLQASPWTTHRPTPTASTEWSSSDWVRRNCRSISVFFSHGSCIDV